MNLKVKSVELDWKSDDGQKVKSIIITEDGEVYKTWSKTIAAEGWSGEVEVYEKNGEKLVKQPWKQSSRSGTKEFKADPAKMKQDYALQVKTNQSIQKQVALKGAVDLIVAGKRPYEDLELTYYDLLNLLNPKLGEKDEND